MKLCWIVVLVGISIILVFLYSLVAMSSRTERFIEQLMEEEGRKDTDEQDMEANITEGKERQERIDRGWSMMKTISQVFVTGVKGIRTTPALLGDVLEYEGKFYKVGTVRQEVKDTKVEDEQFMMLGDAELSRRFSMQDEAEQKAKIDREQANELEYVDESQKSDAAESANASNGSTGAKPVRNPEREKPKWEDTITNRMLHWSYTPEQKEEVKKALAAGVPKATILTYFYAEVTVEKMSSYRNKH